MQASIVKGEEVLLGDVRVSVVEEASLKSWVGFAYLPPGGELGEGEYELRLEDGRSGAIVVVSVKGYIARFRGLGPLA
jgi:hypothetical protein